MPGKFDLKLRSELVAARFNNYLQELWAIDPTVEFASLVKSEAASVWLGAMTRTKAASVAKIRAAHDKREWTTFGGKKYRLANHQPTEIYNQIHNARLQGLNTKLNARGLSKQSFALQAQKLMPQLGSVPAYVSNANYKGRHFPEDGRAVEGSTPAGYILTLFNTSPIVRFAGGEWAVLGAMQGRVSYFRRNMKHRAFQTYESRARKYPGIWVTESAA